MKFLSIIISYNSKYTELNFVYVQYSLYSQREPILLQNLLLVDLKTQVIFFHLFLLVGG